jgi:hypothetical protein
MASRAAQLSGGTDPIILGVLGAAYAEAGQFPEALAAAGRALALVSGEARSPISAALRSQIALYQSRAPVRDPGTNQPLAFPFNN